MLNPLFQDIFAANGMMPIKAGLHIKTVTGHEFDVAGQVTFIDWPEDGRIYYCGGRSFPAKIVAEIYGTAKEAS